MKSSQLYSLASAYQLELSRKFSYRHFQFNLNLYLILNLKLPDGYLYFNPIVNGEKFFFESEKVIF